MAKKDEEVEDAPKSTVTVKAATEGRVGLWEVDPAHKSKENKEGEIFIKDKPMKVAKTSGVANALRDGRLVEA